MTRLEKGLSSLVIESHDMSYIERTCDYCGETFLREKKDTTKKVMNTFCSPKHHYLWKVEKKSYSCTQCSKEVSRRPKEVSQSGNVFCCQSCAATYNNLHKTTGTRRSKLEQWLEDELTKIYPDLDFKFNSKHEINSELDIYIPSMKLAFELNGIYHYEPIHGQEKFASIQSNDQRKFQACAEIGIGLCVIDASGMKHFSKKNSQKYLDIIVDIIDGKRDRGKLNPHLRS